MSESAKARVLEIIKALPDDATLDDAIYEVGVLMMIEKGLVAADADEVITHEEMRVHIDQWFKKDQEKSIRESLRKGEV